MDEKKRSGDRGEALVAAYLRRRGYTVLETQFRTRRGEIDIIARSPEDHLCFVEVKTRKNAEFAEAREFVTPAKQQKLRAAARYYLAKCGEADPICRFDVAEVYLSEGFFKIPRINYIPQAFE